VKLGNVLWLHAVEEFLSLSSTHTHTGDEVWGVWAQIFMVKSMAGLSCLLYPPIRLEADKQVTMSP